MASVGAAIITASIVFKEWELANNWLSQVLFQFDINISYVLVGAFGLGALLFVVGLYKV